MPAHQGKVCVVTGASRGIGRAIAIRFAEEGARIVAVARSEKDLASLKAEIEQGGGECLAVTCDITREADLARVAAEAERAFGGIDVWVNNAGGYAGDASKALWVDIPATAVEDMWRLNVTAQVLGAQAAARSMIRAGKGGVIIFMSSIAGIYTTAGGDGPYGACKAALNHITQSMAIELGRYQIRVNALAPAIVETALTDTFFKSEEERRAMSLRYPLQRLGQPGDVAGAASFLASKDAEWVSGAVMLISGGAVFTSSAQKYLASVTAPAT